ncbi:polysaccharide deacetylase family protein [Paenibacillus sp. LHD-38]|uniref:polysaccharide deacetylase family protein n=1 Tax=Paenibacillus sp. LHD-38 TaxID=3072143 RepID=UPI00280F0349|nr:polysaccharide deacetylase family protein [Paenibacillus sp. LHD-38]MDQ8733902.1 polysaccharide deacetylase family protein [Paenibacillus sp. LHD-38]
MKKAKRHGPKLLVWMMFAAVTVWLSGCSASQTINSLLTGSAWTGPQAEGSSGEGDVVIIDHTGGGSSGSDVSQGNLTGKPPKTQDEGSIGAQPGDDKPDSAATEKPDSSVTDKPDADPDNAGAEVTNEPEQAGTEQPDAQAAEKPEATPTPKPDAAATSEPVTQTTVKPDTPVTNKTDTSAEELDKPDKMAPAVKPGKGEKYIALTFDDGPDQRYTNDILDILKEKEVKATFFVVGQQVKKNPEVLQRIAEEGHAIGNHTYNHKDLSKLNKQQMIEEIKTSDAVIKKTIGFTPAMVRAPYGAVSDMLKFVLKANSRELVGWNIDTRDWAGTSAANMSKMIKNEAKPGGIILMHSFGSKNIKNTVQALPGIIDDLVEMDYTLVTADQLV